MKITIYELLNELERMKNEESIEEQVFNNKINGKSKTEHIKFHCKLCELIQNNDVDNTEMNSFRKTYLTFPFIFDIFLTERHSVLFCWD